MSIEATPEIHKATRFFCRALVKDADISRDRGEARTFAARTSRDDDLMTDGEMLDR